MIREEPPLSLEDMQNVLRAMQVQMRNTALRHLDHIGLRSLFALQTLDLFNHEAPPIGDEVDLAVLRDQHHVRRQHLPDGPLVLYLIEGDETKRMLIELPVLFLSDNRDVRQAALVCFENMLMMGSFTAAPKTLVILKESRDALVSEVPEAWRPAAIAVFDALYDDVLVVLHGVRQCLVESDPATQGSLELYASKLLYPTVSSLDSIVLPIGNPERDHGNLSKLLSDMVARASSLTELCNSYLADLGFLPLSQRYSLAVAVTDWIDSKPGVDIWQEIWDWANSKSTPITKYHACTVFVLIPDLIPDGKLADLWNEVLTVVHVTDKKGANPENEPWVLRRDLARHYTSHLEAQLPDSDGANIACFSWWLAEQVAAIFPAGTAAAEFYRENWVKPASDLSTQIWFTASAPIQRSVLRYITYNAHSPWAVALLTMMGECLDDLAPAQQTEDVRVKFHEALVSNILSSLPFPIETPSDPSFAVECSFANAVLKCAEYHDEIHQKALKQLVDTSRTLGAREGICDALQKLDEASLPDQLAVCIAVKAKTYTDPTFAEGIWAIVSDSEWRKRVLAGVDLHVQSVLIESLSMLLVDNQDKWSSHLPHYIAELCEQEANDEHRKVLFLYVIHTSLASDTVSAVRRLLRGDQKEKFVNYVNEYRVQIENMRSKYPSWVAGKLRGLMASMHVL